jgi:hypothetical protein
VNGTDRWDRASGVRARNGIPRSKPFDLNRTEGNQTGEKQMATGGVAPLHGGEVAGAEADRWRELGWLRGRRSWAEGKRAPHRTRWRGRGHESTGREGRAAVRWPRAGQRNSSEPFRPRGRDLRRAKAWANFSRGRCTLGTNIGELDRAKSAGHRASAVDRHGRASTKAKLDEHRAQ